MMKNVFNISKIEITKVNDPLEAWLRSIRKYKVLSVSEEEEVIARYREGDETAVDELIKSNQRFLLSAAKTYTSSPDEILELISEGNFGLLEALETYDETYGFRFLSYAVHYIKKYMSAYANNKCLVRHRFDPAVKAFLKREKKEWFDKHGTDIPFEILLEKACEKYGRDFKRNGVSLQATSVVLDGGANEEDFGDNSLIDTVAHSKNDAIQVLENEDMRNIIGDAINHVCNNEFEREVIIAKYGLFGQDTKTDFEIETKYGIEHRQLDYVQRKLLSHLKDYILNGKIYKKKQSKFQKEELKPLNKTKKKKSRPKKNA